VHALPRYRSKTAKMQKFPIDSHSNENFICLFFRPPGAANPQTISFPSMMFALPWAKISRRSHHPALRYPQPYKQKTNKKSKLNITPNATLYGEIINMYILYSSTTVVNFANNMHFARNLTNTKIKNRNNQTRGTKNSTLPPYRRGEVIKLQIWSRT